MKVTTTFNLLRKAFCDRRIGKLESLLGRAELYGENSPIDLSVILSANGFDGALHVLCLDLTEQDASKFKRSLSCDFAESVLNIYESNMPGDMRPRRAIDASRGFVDGTVSKEDLDLALMAVSCVADDLYGSAKALRIEFLDGLHVTEISRELKFRTNSQSGELFAMSILDAARSAQYSCSCGGIDLILCAERAEDAAKNFARASFLERNFVEPITWMDRAEEEAAGDYAAEKQRNLMCGILKNNLG